MNSIVKDLLRMGEASPFFLPLIAYLIGIPKIIPSLVLDFALINPFFKNLVYFLGFQSKRPNCPTLSGFSCFGMPSGHTEVHWVFLTYLIMRYLKSDDKTKELRGLIPVFLLTLVTMWQRWYEGKHTIFQIIGGIITGSILGFILYKLFENGST